MSTLPSENWALDDDGLAMKHELYLGTNDGKFILQKSPGDDLVYELPDSKELWSVRSRSSSILTVT